MNLITISFHCCGTAAEFQTHTPQEISPPDSLSARRSRDDAEKRFDHYIPSEKAKVNYQSSITIDK